MTGSDMVERNINAAAEVRFAASIMSRDLANVYKPENFEDTEFYGTLENVGEYETGYLLFHTINNTKARFYEPECDIYEVEYYLEQNEEGTFSLMRRLWPNPNFEFEPGGILTIIAENIEFFDISYYYGEEVYTEWDIEEMEALPDLVEVSIATRPLGLGNQVSETFLVNLIRSVNESTYTVQ